MRWRCSTTTTYRRIQEHLPQIRTFARSRHQEHQQRVATVQRELPQIHLTLSYSELKKAVDNLNRSLAKTSYLFKILDKSDP